jgi:hypothetical protein
MARMLLSMNNLALAEDLEAGKQFEALVDAIVDATPVIIATGSGLDLDDATVQSLINDLGIGMFRPHVIAARYGLSGPQLLEFLKIPEVRRRIKVRKSIWEADDNQPERIRRMYGQLTLESASVANEMLTNPATPAALRIKLLEVTGRFGGADVRGSANNSPDAPTGPMFSVQFVFSGTGKTEQVNIVPNQTQTIEGDPLP